MVSIYVIFLYNLTPGLGLVNSLYGNIYNIGWIPDIDPSEDPPLVIIIIFDNYFGVPFEYNGEIL